MSSPFPFDTTTAVSRLAPSQLDQLEALRHDLDLAGLVLSSPGLPDFPLEAVVTDGTVERSIDVASTLTLTIDDYDRRLRRSGHIAARADVNLDGLWFRLVHYSWDGDTVTLAFEDREVALLREHPDKLRRNEWFRTWAANGPGAVTRLQVVRFLVDEVSELTIPLVTPDGAPKQIKAAADAQTTVARHATRAGGFAPGVKLSAENPVADLTQVAIAKTILDVGAPMVGDRRKVLVVAIMVAIQESNLRNLTADQGPGKNPDTRFDPVGVFQQIAVDGWPASRDVATDAHAFFTAAIATDRANQGYRYGDLGEAVQHSGNHGNDYQPWQTAAERWVNAYGIHGGDTTSDTAAMAANNSAPDPLALTADTGTVGDTTGMFYRGAVEVKGGISYPTREDNWTALGRLADEVRWRRFMVSGTLYFVPEPFLFQSAPRMSISETDVGVDKTSGEIDVGMAGATVTVLCRLHRWDAPPGSVVELDDQAPEQGRWLVTAIRRNLFTADAEVTLKKPRPLLPEAQAPEHDTSASADALTLSGSAQRPTATPPPPIADAPKRGKVSNYIAPLPTPFTTTSEFLVPDGCEGVPGAPANVGMLCTSDGLYHIHGGKDWFAPGGSKVVAPTSGTIVDVQQSRGNSGQVFGGVVKLEQPNGRVWVFRHVDPVAWLGNGTRVLAGTTIATVTNWASGSSHCHIEIWKSFAGGYTYSNMIDPVEYITGRAT